MAVVLNQYPILEYDEGGEGIIRPNRHGRATLPEICVMTFFGEVLEAFIHDRDAEVVNRYGSEMGGYPIYAVTYRDIKICLVRAVVGSASIAMMTDYLISYGVKKLIVCGGCGVLDDIPEGDVIIPVSALRDEGASYHYLPPAREVEPDADMVSVIISTLTEEGVPYIVCKTWTTDAFYRETPDLIAYRREEGCRVVEMECAAIAAVAQFRKVRFGQLLYSGDILFDPGRYDERDWAKNLTAREKLFHLTLESAVRTACLP